MAARNCAYGSAGTESGTSPHDALIDAVEPPPGVAGELCVRGRGQRLFDDIVHAQVQDGVHHPGHGMGGSRAHADQQRMRAPAERARCFRFQPARFRQARRPRSRSMVGSGSARYSNADLGGDAEGGWHRQSVAAHGVDAVAFVAQDLPRTIRVAVQQHHVASGGCDTSRGAPPPGSASFFGQTPRTPAMFPHRSPDTVGRRFCYPMRPMI